MTTTETPKGDTKGYTPKGYTGKPLQVVSWAEKSKNDFQWGKNTADYFIRGASFGLLVKSKDKIKGIDSKQDLYNAYNNDIPSSVFDFATNPLSATTDKYKKFPAEIRPYNILRPNIDLLIGEWNKRPFQYDVVNADGDDAFNSFLAVKDKAFHDNVTQRFVNSFNELHKKENGQETGVPSQAIPDPQTLYSELNITYKDAKALKGYRALKVIELELKIREIWRKLFKDWLIVGEAFTFKIPLHGRIEYLRLSPIWVQYDRGALSPYIEDGDHACAYFRASPSDVVDLFYDILTEEQLKKLDLSAGMNYSTAMFNNIAQLNGNQPGVNMLTTVDLYYTTWKAKKKIGFLSYPDPITGQEQEDVVDEAYKPQAELGEIVEWVWVNEAWHDWRIGNTEHIITEPVPAQRNEVNDFSTCKLPINGKRFSDTESANVSPTWLGMPYQILYIILMYRLELTLAKSKGKIVLMPRDAIPDDDEGGEEGFFWYADAMGFALIEPDKNTNFHEYKVLDLSLYEHIKELIGIIDYVKGQWDELLGITRQRKGQNASSDGLGVTEQAIFRSSVISDLIFTGFEELLERELTGLLDLSKFAWADGKQAHYRNDEGELELLNIDGGEHIDSSYNVFVQNMSAMLDKFNNIKSQINAIAQRKEVKVSTIIDLATTDSLTELKALVKKAEKVEESIIRANSENEAEKEKEIEQMKQEYQIFLHKLDMDKLEREWDRKDNNEIIKAELDKDPGAGIDPYLSTVEQESTKRLAEMEKSRQKDKELANDKNWQQIERDKIKSNEKIAKEKNETALKNKVVGQK